MLLHGVLRTILHSFVVIWRQERASRSDLQLKQYLSEAFKRTRNIIWLHFRALYEQVKRMLTSRIFYVVNPPHFLDIVVVISEGCPKFLENEGQEGPVTTLQGGTYEGAPLVA